MLLSISEYIHASPRSKKWFHSSRATRPLPRTVKLFWSMLERTRHIMKKTVCFDSPVHALFRRPLKPNGRNRGPFEITGAIHSSRDEWNRPGADPVKLETNFMRLTVARPTDERMRCSFSWLRARPMGRKRTEPLHSAIFGYWNDPSIAKPEDSQASSGYYAFCSHLN